MKTRYLTYEGKTLSLKEWATRLKISIGSLHSRLSAGWPVEKALTEPGREYDRTFTFQGETKTLTEWAQVLGVRRGFLAKRLRTLPVDAALGRAKARHFERVDALADILNSAPGAVEEIKAGWGCDFKARLAAVKARKQGVAA